jgi:hypothetical protein
MTEELRKPGRPRKLIEGAETSSREWEHPPLRGHEEEPGVLVSENPTVDIAEEIAMPVKTFHHKTSSQNIQFSEKLDTPIPAYAENYEANIPSGYQLMECAPRDCKIVVSETGEDQTCVYWRIRRVVDKKNLRYIKTGAWTNDFTRLDIDFEPKYWRPYVSSDYFPMRRVK